MLNNFFLLRKLNKENYFSEPFPHIIIENCLDDESYKLITEYYPSYNLFNVDINENNRRGDIFSNEILQSNEIHNVWQKFTEINNSTKFIETIFNFFHKDIINIYPNQFKHKNDFLKYKQGIKNINDFKNSDLLIEMSMAINTPVKKSSAVRNAHLDKPKKIFTALYYLRDEFDKSNGGDLILYKWKDGYSKNKKKFLYQESLSNEHTNEVKRIKYEKNKLVLFINSINSLHAVSPRSVTENYRKFCCITCSSQYSFNNFTPSSKIEDLKLKMLNRLNLL